MGTKDFSSKKHLSEITEEVGLLKEAPPSSLPPPKQWVPRLVSSGIRWMILPFVLLDQAAKKIARLLIQPPFQRTGSCSKRGNCCYYITMRKRRGIMNWFQRFWMFQVHSFFQREKEVFREGKHEYYLLGCSNLKKDGTCKEYKIRPIICREWPIIEIFGYPKILKGCGYWFISKKKEYQHVVQQYNEGFQKNKSPLTVLNDPVEYESPRE